jgi:hypothetical protein
MKAKSESEDQGGVSQPLPFSSKDPFKKIDKTFEKISQAHKFELENAMIKPIHDKYLFSQNGITAMIAKMGAGKSYQYLKLIARQEVLNPDPFYELVVICSTSNKFDKTVQSYREAVKKSKLVAVKDEDLLEYLNGYLKLYLEYDAIMTFITSNFKRMNETLEKIFHENGIRTDLQFGSKSAVKNTEKMIRFMAGRLKRIGWKTFPHRALLIMDDFANHPLLRSKESDLSRMLKKLRHFCMNVIICVQTVKSIPKDIKRTLSDIMLFSGVSHEDFFDLMKEIPAGWINAENLWNVYRNLEDPHAFITVYITARKVVINGG